MGYQQFFRKPQLHRPCNASLQQIPTQPQRATSFFHAPSEKQVHPVPVLPSANGAAPAASAPLFPIAASLISGLLVFLSAMMLVMLLIVR
jgi:hypothetical protein